MKCYTLCHDKGTYDAISLRFDDAKVAREKYIENLKDITKVGGYFVITSCNWTLQELKQQFGSGNLVVHILIIVRVRVCSVVYAGRGSSYDWFSTVNRVYKFIMLVSTLM